ncbi:MAG TPA: L,D-transpeptidase family protein [Bacillus sp. (in: firmicutes)]|nr:L,D-transpeptidase family protein [Bacillus sp. (in: firmicutes)]
MKKWLMFLVLSFLVFFSMGIPASAASGSQFIIINKSTNQLAYYENSQLKRVFAVATGKRPSYTPEGKFKVVNKLVNRPYYKGKIPGGDPRNPLGNRWLGLNARGTWGTTYAIHGNNNPNSIGKYVSNGCIRMYDEQVEWLFNQVKVGTPVIITTSGKSFDSIAMANGFKVTASNITPAPAKPAFASSKVLIKGSRGSDVKELQRLLTAKGYNTKGIDGFFGSNTERAVLQFQKAHNLKVDGVVGPATKKALGMR